jgi:hypothetical protein
MASTRTYPPLARTYRQSGALSNRPRTQHRPPCTASRENTVVASTLPTRSASRACPVRAVVGAILVIALPRFGRTPPPGANTRFAPTCATDRENVVLNEHILGSSTLPTADPSASLRACFGWSRKPRCSLSPRERVRVRALATGVGCPSMNHHPDPNPMHHGPNHPAKPRRGALDPGRSVPAVGRAYPSASLRAGSAPGTFSKVHHAPFGRSGSVLSSLAHSGSPRLLALWRSDAFRLSPAQNASPRLLSFWRSHAFRLSVAQVSHSCARPFGDLTRSGSVLRRLHSLARGRLAI